jgi:hypothetical protein
MKRRLVPSIALAALLLGSLILWNVRSSEGPTPDTHPQLKSAPSGSSVHLSEENAGPEVTTRSEPARATIAPPVLKSELAVPGRATPGAAIASIHQERDETKSNAEPGSLDFERKYAWMNAEDRREALESLRVLLDGGARSGPGNGPALPEERSLEIKREIEWLTQHEAP